MTVHRNTNLSFEKLWGHDGNFTQLPNVLIQQFNELGLLKVEATILEVLISYGLKECTIPVSRIAHDIGRSPGITRKYINSLVSKGFLHKTFHERDSNIYGNTYSWAGTIRAVQAYMKNTQTPTLKSYIPAYDKELNSTYKSYIPPKVLNDRATLELHTNKDKEIKNKDEAGHERFTDSLSKLKDRLRHKE